MADDHYKTLGLNRSATADEIQKAYRELARKHHPDLNPDDKTAKKKFQAVQRAFDVLNDPSKRELYDRYGDAFEQMHGGGGPGAGPQAGPWQTTSGGQPFDFSQFFGEGEDSGGFADLLRQFAQGGGRPQPKSRGRAARKGADLNYDLQVPFQTAISGGSVQLSIERPGGKTESIKVRIPPGIDDGKSIRLRGQGEPAPNGRGTPGDILLAIHVEPHPFFQRRGKDLVLRVPVSLAEAGLGAKVDIPTPQGAVALKIPPGTSSGAKLRVRGRGIPDGDGQPGDLLAEIQIVLPKQINDDAAEALRHFDRATSISPRAELRW